MIDYNEKYTSYIMNSQPNTHIKNVVTNAHDVEICKHNNRTRLMMIFIMCMAALFAIYIVSSVKCK
jgi:hypothetical protein